MHNELQQLLNDLDDGRLDERGRRRLDELCAADPALARRLDQEYRLATLLGRCGPNHAPADLARSVMARLESRNAWSPRQPWFAWVFRPAVGAALAFAAMAVIGVQVGLKIQGWRTPGTGSAVSSPSRVNVAIRKETAPDRKVASVPQSAIRKSKTAPTRSSDRPQSAPSTLKSEARAPASPKGGAVSGMAGQVTQEFPQGPNPALEEFPAPGEKMIASVPPAALIPATPTPAPKVIMGAPVNPAVPLQAPTVPARSAAPRRSTTNPTTLADRSIAMEIYLTPMPQASPKPEAAERTAAPLPYTTSFAPAAGKPKPQALTLKDVEVNLYAVGAEQVSTHAIIGRKNAWEVQASLTPEQFRNFIQQLRGSGIIPGETVTKPQASRRGGSGAAGVDETHIPSSTTNRYEITHGSQWTQPLERLDAVTTTGATREKAVQPRLSIRIAVEQNTGA